MADARSTPMSEYKTVFGSLTSYAQGEIEVIEDDPGNYARSNVFDVALHAAPYEKIVVGKSLEYVLEVLRAEGASDWYTAAHDEFALIMDGRVSVELVKLDALPGGASARGSRRLEGLPAGERMGRMRLGRGHLALLPAGAAYRFDADRGIGVILLQTALGPHSVQRRPHACRTQ